MIVSGSFDEPTDQYNTPYAFVRPVWEDGLLSPPESGKRFPDLAGDDVRNPSGMMSLVAGKTTIAEEIEPDVIAVGC